MRPAGQRSARSPADRPGLRARDHARGRAPRPARTRTLRQILLPSRPSRPPPAARTGGGPGRRSERRPHSHAHGWRSHPCRAPCAIARHNPESGWPPSQAGRRPRRRRSGGRREPFGLPGRAGWRARRVAGGHLGMPAFRPPVPAVGRGSGIRRSPVEPISPGGMHPAARPTRNRAAKRSGPVRAFHVHQGPSFEGPWFAQFSSTNN